MQPTSWKTSPMTNGKPLNSLTIQEAVAKWARENPTLSAPYGVLCSEHVTRKGTPYRLVAFGRAGSLDATVAIYSRNFLILNRSDRPQAQLYRSFNDLMDALKEI